MLVMDKDHPRLSRERKTIEAMVRIACRGRHATRDGLCDRCDALLSYALERLDRCPFQADKPTCAQCPIHCYRSPMRDEIRAVMTYAGPRMLFRRPLLALAHLFDRLRHSPDDEAIGERQPQRVHD